MAIVDCQLLSSLSLECIFDSVSSDAVSSSMVGGRLRLDVDVVEDASAVAADPWESSGDAGGVAPLNLLRTRCSSRST